MSAQLLQPDPDLVLRKAFLSASKQLHLTQSEMAAVLGKSRQWVNNLAHDETQALPAQSKHGELALMLIRLARALYALNDGDQSWTRHFMRTHNTVTCGIPAVQIQSIAGMIAVVQFVDAIRGKV